MGVALETLPWRATGTCILRGVDDIQVGGTEGKRGSMRGCARLLHASRRCSYQLGGAGLTTPAAAPARHRHHQALLDDQIVKTQSMRASPYIGPFEERVRVWEARLDLTQVRCRRPAAACPACCTAALLPSIT